MPYARQTQWVLREWIASLRCQCVPGARALGLAYESAAIKGRFRRVGNAWASHLQSSKQAILQAAVQCTKRERALIVGAGACFDIPVPELAGLFDEVVLTDAVIGTEARNWARRLPNRVRAIGWDATGFLARLANARAVSDANAIIALINESAPEIPPRSEADLTVSANCLSQLGLVAAEQVDADDESDGCFQKCIDLAAAKHLAWLRGRAGVRVLLSDIARLDVAPDGREISQERVFKNVPLPSPDRIWRWKIAPIPERSREYHRVHEVGVWIDG
ncbi:MAG: hypothetical protein QM790_05440 [Nibricoccus sp.]